MAYTLAQVVDAVWATEIQPGTTALQIVEAWLRYAESVAGSVVQRISGSAGGGRVSMFYPDDGTLSVRPFDIEADDIEIIELAFSFLRAMHP